MIKIELTKDYGPATFMFEGIEMDSLNEFIQLAIRHSNGLDIKITEVESCVCHCHDDLKEVCDE